LNAICSRNISFFLLQQIYKFGYNCLETADKVGYKSIAIPAMGTGKISYPRDKVAAYMYDLVEKFANNNKQSKVSEVIFVVHYKDPKSKQVISLTEQSLYSESSISNF